nr:Neurotransmitter-gated ion-channel transmembrane region domain containing protein [Haemonchus contortus]
MVQQWQAFLHLKAEFTMMLRDLSKLKSGSVDVERNTYEKLYLQRKIGEGILTKRSTLKKSRSALSRDTPSMSSIGACSTFRTRPHIQNGASAFIKCYSLILKRLKQEEWKYAALVLDRLCLILFTLLMSSFGVSMIISTPHFDA